MKRGAESQLTKEELESEEGYDEPEARLADPRDQWLTHLAPHHSQQQKQASKRLPMKF